MNNYDIALTEYTYPVTEAFFKFRKGYMNVDQLISVLRGFESEARKTLSPKRKPDEGMWFRFFEGDPAVTTIDDIERTFSNGTELNRQHMLDCMNVSIGLEDAPIVYFS